MTLRDALSVDARHVYERVDEVLNSEDGIILLVDRRHATSYLQGFALSGCQIELLSVLDSHMLSDIGMKGFNRLATDQQESLLLDAIKQA